jgi:P2 phage tail completion protein R (GpR)
MIKPASLRAALLAALPDVAADPQRLSIFVERGQIRATGAPGAGWEYAYQVTVILQDFAGDMDNLAGVIVGWVAKHQPDVLKNAEARQRAIRFECELMTSELADVSIEIDLTEAVDATNGGAPYQHPPEPPADPTADWLWQRR